MGSATREALAKAKDALGKLGGTDGLAIGEQLFEAGRVIGDSAQLRSALADPSTAAEDKAAVIGAVFSGIGAAARDLLAAVVGNRWSTQDDLLAGIEEIGIRAVAGSAGKDVAIEAELFAFG